MHDVSQRLSNGQLGSQFRGQPRRWVLVRGISISLGVVLGCVAVGAVQAQEGARPAGEKRVLLLATVNDGHPHATHEYLAGMRILKKCLEQSPGVRPEVVQVDELWRGGPDLLDKADGAVLFATEGARWLSQDPDRVEAFRRLAQRGGGLACLHWGMGCKDAKYIDTYVQLFGGCHGGPDRKYKVVELQPTLANDSHPINRHVLPPRTEEEFYYRLKFPKSTTGIVPLWQVAIDQETHTVAWGWERPDKERGRSFGFSGLHFHKNWSQPAYRRLMTQGVLWTLKLPIPEKGAPVDVSDEDLKLAPPAVRPSSKE